MRVLRREGCRDRIAYLVGADLTPAGFSDVGRARPLREPHLTAVSMRTASSGSSVNDAASLPQTG